MTRGYMKKRQNFSSYITKNDRDEIEVYAKTYGANKKEATMLCAAMAKIALLWLFTKLKRKILISYPNQTEM